MYSVRIWSLNSCCCSCFSTTFWSFCSFELEFLWIHQANTWFWITKRWYSLYSFGFYSIHEKKSSFEREIAHNSEPKTIDLGSSIRSYLISISYIICLRLLIGIQEIITFWSVIAQLFDFIVNNLKVFLSLFFFWFYIIKFWFDAYW